MVIYNDIVKFVKVNTNDLLNYIYSAKKRIVFAKPAFDLDEINAILDLKKKKQVTCNLYIESGDKAVRYGFGDTKALQLINDNLQLLNVQTVERIRMAILIVDDKTLVYAPNLSFIEEEIDTLTFPNGFFGDKAITEQILKEFSMKSGSNSVAHKYNNIVPFPGCIIPQVETEKISKQISKSVKLLEQNPAVDPSKLRKVSFYRSNYKIVKIQVIGIRIENKKINLNPFISLLSNHNKKMTRSWKVFDYDDVNSLQKTIEFESELDKIKNEFLLDAGRFGYIIDVNKKKNFIESVNTLKEEFVDYLKGKINKKKENRFVKKSEEQHNKCDLTTLLKNSKEDLNAILLSIAKEDKLFIKKICDSDRQLSYKIKDGEISDDEAVTEHKKVY